MRDFKNTNNVKEFRRLIKADLKNNPDKKLKSKDMAFPHDGKKFTKGVSGNPKGRPRKYCSTLKAQGYKLTEVNDCIQVMIQMTLNELKEVYNNANATALEKTIAGAIKKSLERGDLASIETLLNRVYGKPKETVDASLSGEVKVTLNLNP